jgi:hypothetical protein
MKLFQQMLVATASVGLIAPLAAQASDIINIDGMNDYNNSKNSSTKRFDNKSFANEISEELANLKGRVDGLEVLQNELEAGSFSDTTTLSGKAIFTVGALDNPSLTADYGTLGEGLAAQYTYQMNLNTSFTGDDDLYVRLKTGNAAASFKNKLMGSYLSSTNTYNDVLKIDKIWYSFPVGEKITAWVGPKIENYYMHGASPSIYKPVLKGFKLGGNGAAYGASTDSGFGVAYNADNGFSVSSNLVSDQNGTGSGFLSNEVDENWSTQIAYTKPNYHVSLMVALKYDGWKDQYYSTALGSARTSGSTNYGLRGYWRPENSGTATPSISVGYDISTIDEAASTVDETDAYFVGLTWNDMFQSDDSIGIAFGQPQTREDEVVDPFMWEAYYSFKPNDSVTITPAVFGGSDVNGTSGQDITGAVVETTFKF